jgi:hypothetical protein
LPSAALHPAAAVARLAGRLNRLALPTLNRYDTPIPVLPDGGWPMLRAFGCWLLVLLCPVALFAQGGRLDQVRQNIQQPSAAPAPTPAPASSTQSSSSVGDPTDDGSISLDELFSVVAVAALIPFTIAELSASSDSAFPSYPYDGDYPGYIWREHHHKAFEKPPDDLRWYAFRVSIEDGDDFSSVNRLNGRLSFDTSTRFGVETNWNYFTERRGCGCFDESILGDTNLTFRCIEQKHVEMHFDAGFRMYADPYLTRFGPNVGLSADVFPVDPLICSTNFDWGMLGEANVWHARATAGAILHGWEFFGGYDFLRIGSVNLQGPLVGVRFWF